MANMSYCRYENTYQDLLNCYDALINDSDLSITKKEYCTKLIMLCRQISKEFEGE